MPLLSGPCTHRLPISLTSPPPHRVCLLQTLQLPFKLLSHLLGCVACVALWFCRLMPASCICSGILQTFCARGCYCIPYPNSDRPEGVENASTQQNPPGRDG